jgi:hypothetical protein
MLQRTFARGGALLVLAAALLLGGLACSDDSDEAVAPTVTGPTRSPQPAIGTGPPVADVAVGAATVAPGGEVTVELVVSPQEGVTVGALDAEVVYDSAVLQATSCAPESCSTDFAANTVRFSLASLDGYDGPAGSVTFTAIGAAGAVSPLTVVLQTCANVEADIISCSATDGSVTITAE